MGRPPKADAKLPFPPFGSFDSFLKDLAAMDVLPNVIDQGVFGQGYSGSAKSQILQAFRSFRLIDSNGVPDLGRLQPLLDDRTKNTALLGIMREFYATLFALPLASATPRQVNEWFGQHGLDPQTTRKARAFFLAAAKATGATVHSTVLSKTRRGGGRRRVPKRSVPVESPTIGLPASTAVASATTKRIEFRSGGWASLAFDVDWNTLSKSDRTKLFEWLDSITEYEKAPTPKSAAASASSQSPASSTRTTSEPSTNGLPEYEFKEDDEEVPF